MPREGIPECIKRRRAGRVARRRQEILAAAARIFAEKGFATTTVAEIADAAFMGEGTLYNYFKSKREVLLAVAAETSTPLERVIDAAEQVHDRAQLVDLVQQALDLPEAELAPLRAVISETWLDDELLREFFSRRLERVHHRLTAFVARYVADGQFRDVDPGLTAQLAMGMFASVMLPVIRGSRMPQGETQRRAVAEAIVALLFDGLARA